MTTDEIITYYKSLLIIQYASLRNALGTIEAFITALIQSQIINQVQDGFDVTTAIGSQLDILGTYVGVTRHAFGLVPGSYWSLPFYSDTLPGTFNGWASYADTDPPIVKWLQYNDLNGLAYTLTDSQMRQLIQLRAELGHCQMGLGDIDNILYSYFGTYVTLIDNNDMSVIYQHDHLDPDPDLLWSVAVLENAFPHQAGVAVSFVEA